MSLPVDVVRCLGDGNWGAVCPKREQCQRYVGGVVEPGSQRLRFSPMVCRGEKWDGFIPVRDAGNKIA